MAFTYTKLDIPDVIRLTATSYTDERGYFREIFRTADFAKHEINVHWRQINHSSSKQNVLRGLHYQLQPHAQAKLVVVVSGSIYDVAVDLRPKSASFGHWVATTIGAADNSAIYVPAGFAHGFVVTSPRAEVIYFCDQEYDLAAERGIIWNDPFLAIPWPINKPVLSAKDNTYPTFKQAEMNF